MRRWRTSRCHLLVGQVRPLELLLIALLVAAEVLPLDSLEPLVDVFRADDHAQLPRLLRELDPAHREVHRLSDEHSVLVRALPRKRASLVLETHPGLVEETVELDPGDGPIPHERHRARRHPAAALRQDREALGGRKVVTGRHRDSCVRGFELVPGAPAFAPGFLGRRRGRERQLHLRVANGARVRPSRLEKVDDKRVPVVCRLQTAHLDQGLSGGGLELRRCVPERGEIRARLRRPQRVAQFPRGLLDGLENGCCILRERTLAGLEQDQRACDQGRNQCGSGDREKQLSAQRSAGG